jgi:hypothetical protein
VSEYPEHDKLKANSDKTYVLSEFIDWLSGEDIEFCEMDGRNDCYWPTRRTPEALIGGFLGIDPKKLNAEKEAMLQAMREMNS